MLLIGNVLGMCGFYQRFVPDFAVVAVGLWVTEPKSKRLMNRAGFYNQKRHRGANLKATYFS